jgi:COP9 signalosome complex subunit 7
MEDMLAAVKSVGDNLSPALVVDLIQRSIRQKGLFNFAEIYHPLANKVSSNPDLQTDMVSVWLQMLQIFTYGTWTDYKNFSSSQFELETDAQKKLKELTLTSMASQSSLLDFDMLVSQLEIERNDLERFIIDTMYDGLITGKINTKLEYVEIKNVQSRDPDPTRLAAVAQILKVTLSRSESIIDNTDGYIKHSRDKMAAQATILKTYDEYIHSLSHDGSSVPLVNRR